MIKNIEWLKNEVNKLPLRFLGFSMLKQREEFTVSKDDVLELIDQLDEPEVLSQEITKEQAYDKIAESFPATAKEIETVLEKYYSSMLIEFSEEQVQKYLSEHGIEVVEKEPETVASVIADFWKSFERFKEVLSMEVEELEE